MHAESSSMTFMTQSTSVSDRAPAPNRQTASIEDDEDDGEQRVIDPVQLSDHTQTSPILAGCRVVIVI